MNNKKVYKVLLWIIMILGACIIKSDMVFAAYGRPGAGHICQYNVSSATCTTAKKCKQCGYVAQKALGHTGGSATCQSRKKCTRCGTRYGSYASHKYTSSCGKVHCSGYKCKWCGKHKGTCGGGHNSNTCDHCKITYCSKCVTHTPKVDCPCNTDGTCPDNNIHCADVRFCTMCNDHTHMPCDTAGICTVAHCGQIICSVCKVHECSGGHRFDKYVADDPNSIEQEHTLICSIEGCGEPSGSHKANWGIADSSHTSKCLICGLTYTHEANWSANIPDLDTHFCMWNGINICNGRHFADWDGFYKKTDDEKFHIANCKIAGCNVEKSHEFKESTDSTKWIWIDNSQHMAECEVDNCNLSNLSDHHFSIMAKEPDNNYTELYTHKKVCAWSPQNRVEEEHTAITNGECDTCHEILWKMIQVRDDSSEYDITYDIADEKTINAVNLEKVKIIINKTGTAEYVTSIYKIGSQEIIQADNNGYIYITENGEYEFQVRDDEWVEFTISHISNKIMIDKIIEPITSTTGSVTVLLRSNISEKNFEKNIFIKQEDATIVNSDKKTTITQAELNSGNNPYDLTTEIFKNGTYYFSARDTAGNEGLIIVEIDNIVKGQTTVAISYDVFRGGEFETDILVNPDKKWNIKEAGTVSASIYKIGEADSKAIEDKNIKLYNVRDMQLVEVEMDENDYYPSGAYYLHIGIGGDIFNEAGTYIIDLQGMDLDLEGDTQIEESTLLTLEGKNRIVVEVHEFNDLT